MTDDTKTICRRCGFANIPGDQFCGSCGAFLEWEGQPTSDAPGQPVPPVAPSSAVPVAGVGSGDAGTGSPAAGPAPVAFTPAPAPAPGSGSASSDLLRCPACGIANPAGRTFCQSCGATLAAASRVQEPPKEVIAAAVSAVPTAPPASPSGATLRQAKPARRGRGIPGWVVAVGALGLVVGIVIVLGGILLRGTNPSSGSTASNGAAGGLSSSSPSGASSGGPGSSAAAASSVKLHLTGATASSSVLDLAKFQPTKAIDGDLTTSWQEGKSTEKGEWIEVAFASSRADAIVIRNGYQASTQLYKGNRRLKDVLISVGGGAPIATRLKDTEKAQTIDLGGVAGATSVRMTIVSTYPGQKTSVAGTPFDDAAVSEITVMGVPGG
jgi:hypothetical protein